MIRVPYGKRPQQSIEKIEAGDITLYMTKIGDLTPNERPPAMQELESVNRELQQIILSIAESIQEQYPVEIGLAYYKAATLRRLSKGRETVQQATTSFKVASGDTGLKLVDGAIPLDINDWLVFPGVDAPVVINRVIATNYYEIIAIGQDIPKGVTGHRVNLKLADYASQSEIERIKELNTKAPEVALQSATLFMRHRVLFPVEGCDAVKAGSQFIRVPQLNIELQQGDRIKFVGANGNRTVTVTVADAVSPSEDETDIAIEPSPGDIVYGTTGYLMKGDRLKSGISDWQESDTRNLPDDVIAAIFKFHQSESIAPKPKGDGDDAEPVGNGGKSSNKSGSNPQLTGENITGESKGTESQTNDSVPKALEAAHAA